MLNVTFFVFFCYKNSFFWYSMKPNKAVLGTPQKIR